MEVEIGVQVGVKKDITPLWAIVQHEALNFLFNFLFTPYK